ncbi:MAG: tetratricopeptide repeat protein [Candidatus Magasanikbacteria bacterium]|nr:tetratricopeptide repeat protein [Candidatus Magasanikbacteria bacterium]
MSYSIIPFILVLLALVVIIVVLIRKFPQLTLLDVENLPEVKEEKKKDDFLKKRVDKKNIENKEKITKKIEPLIEIWKKIQIKFRKYVGKVKLEAGEKTELQSVVRQATEKNEKQKDSEITSEVDKLLKEGDAAYEQEDYEKAEEKYIEAIRVDAKNISAYRGLGDVYVKQGQLSEAKETYKFLLQLDEDDDYVLIKLGDVFEKEGNYAEAIRYYEKAILLNPNISNRFAKFAELLESVEEYGAANEAILQALELEPQNPKYLDKLVEISILIGQKSNAEEAFKRLRMVNPENQKLLSFRQRIDEME